MSYHRLSYFWAWLLLLCIISAQPSWSQQNEDRQRLAMGIDYFQSGKYHEAKLLIAPLDKQYRLNPRYRAYLGVCYYYDWEYSEATAILDSVIPKLKAFAPQERSFYCFAAAESHFNLTEYDEALPLYEQMVTLCKEAEKPDAYYRIGFIYVYKEQWVHARDALQTAHTLYSTLRSTEVARIAQIGNMIRGCNEKIAAMELQNVEE